MSLPTDLLPDLAGQYRTAVADLFAPAAAPIWPGLFDQQVDSMVRRLAEADWAITVQVLAATDPDHRHLVRSGPAATPTWSCPDLVTIVVEQEPRCYWCELPEGWPS